MKQRYISFSGGVESTTMCILYGKGAKAIFADTGAEHKEIYKRIELVRDYCTRLHNGDFELIQVKADRFTKDGSHFDNLTDYIIHSEYMPSHLARFCTRLFKIYPIEKYLKSKGEIEMLIGLNYDEQGRTGNLQALKNCEYKYPLIDDELDRDDCINILNMHGLNPNFPVYMLRGGCKYCFFKRQSEYEAMYYLDNDTFNEVKDLEQKIQGSNKKFFTIMPNGKSMEDLETKCSMVLFSEEEMKAIYNKVEKTTYCGGFCHR